MAKQQLIFVSVLNENVGSHRFRVAKIAPLLRERGIRVDIIRVRTHRGLGGAWALAWALIRTVGEPHIVVFQKTMSFALASLARSLGAKVLMDWDDGSFQRIDGSFYPERFQDDFQRWVGMMDGAVVSCQKIADWLLPWNPRSYIIPTCLDVENYSREERSSDQDCVVGWVGSTMSQHFLKPIESALRAIAKLPRVGILTVGKDDPKLDSAIGARFIPWKLYLEPTIFAQIDIGIMPLPDNDRARMKAGFKLLQYMAAGIPVVASPVGANRDIVRHGWNGFLAETTEDWEHCLALLIKDQGLRARMGENGRRFARENYSLKRAANLWEKACEGLIAGTARR